MTPDREAEMLNAIKGLHQTCFHLLLVCSDMIDSKDARITDACENLATVVKAIDHLDPEYFEP